MLTVFVAICLAGTPVQDCNSDTALDWLVAPERQMDFGGCLMHGQHYAAQSHLSLDGAYLKVFCRWGDVGRAAGKDPGATPTAQK